ncbi:MAG TPA: glutathione S-transferase family protein, partial [Steroidobacteraceae bacterium]
GEVEIFDSTQIFEYLEDSRPTPPLWPITAPERAEARRLEHCSDEVFFPHVIRLMGMRGKPDPIESHGWIESRNGINSYYSSMERQLADRLYVAKTFSYADIAFYMAQFFAARHTIPITTNHPHLLAWRGRMFERPAVGKVITAMGAYLESRGALVPPFGRETT